MSKAIGFFTVPPKRYHTLLFFGDRRSFQSTDIAYLRHNQLHTFDATELEIASQEVQTLVQGILNGHYPAVPSQENCQGCSYGEICELRHNESSDGNSSTVEAMASVRNGS